jgi:hypothetical protein
MWLWWLRNGGGPPKCTCMASRVREGSVGCFQLRRALSLCHVEAIRTLRLARGRLGRGAKARRLDPAIALREESDE